MQGDYIVLVDHDDIVPPEALFEFAKALNEDETIDVLYSDEDKISMNGKKYFEPHFKSDYNPDLLCSMNYICHLFAVKRTLQQQIGLFQSEYDGAQDYDFIFRCCEAAQNIRHICRCSGIQRVNARIHVASHIGSIVSIGRFRMNRSCAVVVLEVPDQVIEHTVCIRSALSQSGNSGTCGTCAVLWNVSHGL